ncbi:MAG: D-serine ammonia-lyase [Oscillibacter sp.]
MHVGSTGNLGLSIGIMGAALGYRVTVHMSADARQWKKDLLRAKGVTVLEYGADYSYAVQKGRERAAEDPRSYFIDDENSVDLFLGYAVAARRLKAQLAGSRTSRSTRSTRCSFTFPAASAARRGGICFGLKQEFGDAAHVYFAEPVEAPCMLLGLASGLQNAICVQDIGLTGRTAADGLAVSRPSGFVGETVKEMVGGGFTVSDEHLFNDLHALHETEGLFVEPSACAGFAGAVELSKMTDYLESSGLGAHWENAAHIVWATGGALVPEGEREKYLAN